jgi:hypothetical protein
MDDGDKILKAILAEPALAEDTHLAGELARAFHRGKPLEGLRMLLCSDDVRLCKAGLFIAFTLGRKALPLLDDIVLLLGHPTGNVRYHSIRVIGSCARRSEGAYLYKAISLLDDEQEAIRQQIFRLLRTIRQESLLGVVEFLAENEPDSRHLRGLRWLLSSEGGNADQIEAALRSEEPLLRKYGLVAAARLLPGDVSRKLLAEAVNSNDAEVSRFSHELLSLRQAIETRKAESRKTNPGK